MIFGRLVCWWKGKHVRGKPVRFMFNGEPVPVGDRVFACPRCGHLTTYKLKAAPAYNGGDQA